MANSAAPGPAPAPAVPPKVHPGERLANYFDNFFKTVVAISTFGSSLTFTKIVQTPVTPWEDYGFSKLSIQYFLSNAFLFFVLNLGLTSFAASALVLYRPQAVEWFGTDDSRHRRAVMWYATVVTGVLFGLLITAFVFVALVVTAYAGPAGWCALGATIIFGALGFGTILWQSPLFRASIGSNKNTIMTDMRIYGYMDEKTNRYTTPMNKRNHYDPYTLEGRPSAAYTPERRLSTAYNGHQRQDSGYADDARQDDEHVDRLADVGYNVGKGTAVGERYVEDKLSWGNTTVPHFPITAADHYYEDRRNSRVRRTSAPAPKYYGHDERI